MRQFPEAPFQPAARVANVQYAPLLTGSDEVDLALSIAKYWTSFATSHAPQVRAFRVLQGAIAVVTLSLPV